MARIKKIKVNNTVYDIGTQADWNQSDETAADYIKNRTHWVEKGQTMLLDNIVLRPDTETDITLPENLSDFPVVGNSYHVIYDGVRYENLVAFTDNGFRILGAPGATPTQEIPFSMFYFTISGSPHLGIIPYSDSSSHTISIAQNEDIIHKIDKKYLPDSVIVPISIDYINGMFTPLSMPGPM